MNNILKVEHLKKNYNQKKALDGVSFEVKQGEILGLLGPNGAGKTTIINILTTVLSPTSGKITFLNHDLKKSFKQIKRDIGIVPQDLAIYEEISAEKNVRFFASLYKLKKDETERYVKDALELVQLYDKKNEKPKTFSGGMKRRLNIACGIAHRPKLIIMDEPTVGIDPHSRNHILESIKTLKNSGATVIYSTHYMEEVEAISDRIIIMNEGKIIAKGTKEELNQKVNDEIMYSFQLTSTAKLKERMILEIDGVIKVHLIDDNLQVTVDKSSDNLSEIISVLSNADCKITSMNSKKASLETVFLELTGKSLRD